MAVRAIRRRSGTSQLRAALPNAIDILADSADGDRLKYKDGSGNILVMGGASASDGLSQYAEVTLTNAQLKTLRASPVTIVPAPGAGKAINFLSAWLKLIAGANVLTETTANLAFKYTDGSGVQVSETIECTGFIDQAADTITEARPKIDPIVASVAGAVNKPLVLHNLGAGEYAGNAANDATLKVKVWYAVVTV